ncbi:adenosylcobinamide-GDP ribazoletransferase [Prosthecomicrobium sp. N25]|uniref:adenosylcobinamide-GDP ribazoletransferase n=1 Tax=Prosthecomicrobium sp. N25 TaxID=3129254 RepID=UPI00307771D2
MAQRDQNAGAAARLAADLAGMVRFFSRLPVPRIGPADDPAAMPDFGRAVVVLPFASLVIAGPAAALLWLLGSTSLPAPAAAALALAAGLLATGALHEDGLADTADGFGGGASRARKLEIMKDSRIGSYGAAALALSLLIRTVLLAALVEDAGAQGAALGLLAAAAVSRSTAICLVAALPPARIDGAGRAAGTVTAGAAGAGFAIAAGTALLIAAAPIGGDAVLGAAAAAGAAVAGLGLLAVRQIGGQTGDVVGAGQQVAEIAFLSVAAAAVG